MTVTVMATTTAMVMATASCTFEVGYGSNF
jgi:hypothetical protein